MQAITDCNQSTTRFYLNLYSENILKIKYISLRRLFSLLDWTKKDVSQIFFILLNRSLSLPLGIQAACKFYSV
jgi:hypothetical protein